MSKRLESIVDEDLFLLLQKEDVLAFAEIYNRFWNKLYNTACNKLEDVFLAEDIVQELFVEIWKNRERIQITKSVSAYLNTALKNKVIKARLKLHKEHFQKENFEYIAKMDQSYENSDNLQFDELRAKLETSIKNLPEKCQLIYKMNREEDKSSKEIASLLNLSQKTVESHLYRALKVLKKDLLYLFYVKYILYKNKYKILCSMKIKKGNYIYENIP